MIKTLLLAVSLGLTVNANQAVASSESLFETYPVNPELTTKIRGNEVTLPFHIQGTTTAIVSFTKAKKADKFIDNENFKAVNIKCNGELTGVGVGVLYIQDVKKSPVGTYQESVNTMMVQHVDAPDLELGCPPPVDADQLVKMDYLLNAFGIMAASNQYEADNGLPHKYAMYNDHLELNNRLSILAGRKIWGYPKFYSDFTVNMTDESFSVNITNDRTGNPILDFSYARQIGLETPLYNIGDNVLPERNLPNDEQLPQLSGILATCDNTTGWIQPFIGSFTAHEDAGSRTSRALRRTGFNPVAIMEFTNVCGVALPAYSAN